MSDLQLTNADLLLLGPKEILAQVLARETRQVQMRHTWLRALMVHSKSSQATSFNLRCDTQTRQIRKSDLIIESSSLTAPCLLEASLLVSAIVEGRTSFNKFDRINLSGTSSKVHSLAPRLLLSAVDGRAFLGCIALHDSAEGSESTAIALQRTAPLKVWEKATHTLLRESSACANAGPKERQAFLYTDDGRHWMRTPGPDIWASAEYIELMQCRLREFTERSLQEQEFCFQGASLRFSRVSGAEGSGILVVIIPTLPSQVSTFTLLSPTQRLVCLHIACGFTVGETSATLKRSEGTVKGHLRKAYELLGIRTQAELALKYEGAFDWYPEG